MALKIRLSNPDRLVARRGRRIAAIRRLPKYSLVRRAHLSQTPTTHPLPADVIVPHVAAGDKRTNMPPLSTADHYPSHLEESDHGATSRHITVWADSDEECDALLDLFFDAIRKGGSGLEVLNGCNQKTLDTTAVSIVPECDALLNVDVDGTNGTSASKTGLCGGPASGSSRSTEQSCQSDDSNGNVCGFCESDSICEYGPPMKATLCVQCGISGHGASTCPLGHPEDIELGDMEESDSDDHLDEVYPLLSLYIASQEALDLMPKRLVIKVFATE